MSDLTGGLLLRRHLLKVISKKSHLPYNDGMEGDDKWNANMMAPVLKRVKGKVVEQHANDVSCIHRIF
jgi:hypothetical protein